MTKIYRVLQDITGTSEDTINSILEHAEGIANNEHLPLQERHASLLQSLYAYFDETRIRARKVLNHINLYALGVCGPSAYADTKNKTNHPYNQAKGDAVTKLRPILNQIQELSLFQINQANIIEIINELHAIRLKLNASINAQNKHATYVDNTERFYDFLGKTRSHSGGKIGEVINGKYYKNLMYTLAGLFIFARIKEKMKNNKNHLLDEKYQIPSKPQPLQSQMILALEQEEKQILNRFEKSGKNLFAVIKEQTRVAETSIDSATIKSEKKFETMLVKTSTKNQYKNARLKSPTTTEPATVADNKDHKHKQMP